MQDVLGDATAADVTAAWRLAFAVTGDATAADAAVEAAVAGQVSWLGLPSPVELLGATFREADGSTAAPDPRAAVGDPLIDSWWSLPVDQRAALWLSAVDDRTSEVTASILSVAPGAVDALLDAARDQLVPRPAAPDCPTTTELAALDAGAADDSERSTLRRHLRRCDSCPGRLEAIQRIGSLGDPETGPVPVATDAGRTAFAACAGTAAVAAPGQPQVSPTAGVPSPSRSTLRPGDQVRRRASAGRPAAAPSAPTKGAVAAAALAAFSTAMGETPAPTPPSIAEAVGLARPIEGTPPAESPAEAVSTVEPPVADGSAETGSGEGGGGARRGRLLGRRRHTPDATPADEVALSPTIDPIWVDETPEPAEPAPGAAHAATAATAHAAAAHAKERAHAQEPAARSDDHEPAEPVGVDFWYPPVVSEADDPITLAVPIVDDAAENKSETPTGGGRWPSILRSAATPRVLAGAAAGILVASVVTALVLPPPGLPHYETVHVGASSATTLFPGDAGVSPATSATGSAPLLIVPGPDVSTTLPAPTTTASSTTTTAPRSSTTSTSTQRASTATTTAKASTTTAVTTPATTRSTTSPSTSTTSTPSTTAAPTTTPSTAAPTTTTCLLLCP